jgi:hypothetical protein
MNLYFLTELLNGRKEVWEYCRTFGMISERFIKRKISYLIIFIDTFY